MSFININAGMKVQNVFLRSSNKESEQTLSSSCIDKRIWVEVVV